MSATQTMPIPPVDFSENENVLIQKAVASLKRGNLVAFPTETVYGLGADAENVKALQRLYEVKGRPVNHPVIVHLGETAQLADWAIEIPETAWRLARAFWPGPLTLILKRAVRVPDAVTGGQDMVGLRVPNHPLTLKLLQAFGGGLAGPSANRFGRLSPTCAAHVQADLGNDVDHILDGGHCQVGVESTIVAFRGSQPVILRPGMITSAQIHSVLAEAFQQASDEKPEFSETTVSRAPGTLASHYAPVTPLRLVSTALLKQSLQEPLTTIDAGIGILARFEKPRGLPETSRLIWHAIKDEPEAYARQLYASLRELDTSGVAEIWVEQVPDEPQWLAVTDRLARAAYQESDHPT